MANRPALWWPAGIVVVLAILIVAGAIAMADRLQPDAFTAWLAPHRRAWYALPAVVVAFVVLGVAMVPVLLLVAATGAAFGPWLGPAYAMAGCLASASTGFAIGRWLGRRRVEALGGERVRRLTLTLERNGTLAVFLLRKIPAPFLLANVVAGAAPVRYRDFVLGTLLGMAAIVIALAGFGYQLPRLLDHPSPSALLTAALFVAIPLSVAWILNRVLRRSRYGA